MDNRIQEVEQMIVDCNAHMLAKKQLSLKSAQDWKIFFETFGNIPKTAIMEPEEQSQPTEESILQNQPSSLPEPVCSKCGKTLKAGAKFCKFCGTQVGPSTPFSQPAPERLCTCGAKIITGAKFCRNCGQPVL